MNQQINHQAIMLFSDNVYLNQEYEYWILEYVIMPL